MAVGGTAAVARFGGITTALAAGYNLSASVVVGDKGGLAAVVDAFNKANPGSKVDQTSADTDQYQTTLRVQLTSGAGPDVFFMWPGNGNALALAQIGGTGFVRDLSDRPFASRIPEKFKLVTQYEGKTMIMPMSETLIGAIYNKDAFDKAGVQVPKTWSELIAACEKLKAAGTVPIALGNGTGWVTQLINYALVPTTVYSNVPDFDAQMKAGKATFAGSGWADSFNLYLDLNKRGFFNENPLGTAFEDTLGMVATGQAAMVVQVSAILGAIKGIAKHDRFGIFALPGSDDLAKIQIPSAAGAGYAVNAKTKNEEAALAFIDFMGTDDTVNLYAGATGTLPGIPNTKFKVDPAFEPIMPYVLSGKGVPFMDQLWPNAKVQQVHFAMVQEVFAGKTSVDDALKRMDEAYKSA